MTNIATLRKMVNNGWTIANRKNILAHIDKSDLKDLTKAAKKSGIDIDDLKFDMFESHLKPRLHKTYIGDEEFIEKDYVDDEEIQIVRSKKFDIKPMYPEDACIQMELLGHSFFVFVNAETDQVNVVYKRKGNTYGIMEPDV